MVQLQSSPASDVEDLLESFVERDSRHDDSSGIDTHDFTALQLALNPPAFVYHGYETYIEDGLICLRHKIRNIEKKKLKLEGYKVRLDNGEKLNQDQMEAVARYEEVVHNLMFAKELQKTISTLTQDLLRAQRKAVHNEQVRRMEAEQKRMSVMLQMHYVLFSLQSQAVRKNFCNLQEYAGYLSTQELENLLDLASLVGCKRDDGMSLEAQMEKASLVCLDLLNGKNKPVVGSTYKCLKEKLLRLVDCGFFDHLPDPQNDQQNDNHTKSDSSYRPSTLPAEVSLNLKAPTSTEFLNRHYIPEADLNGHRQDKEEMPLSNWKAEFLPLKEQEPPDSWDLDFSDASVASQAVESKPWKGAAGFIPKTIITKATAVPKQKRQKKNKGSQESKSDVELLPGEVNSPSSLAKDPALRRKQLDHLMDQISGSFSFMQDSLLDGDFSPTCGLKKGPLLSPGSSPLVQREQKKIFVDILPHTQHSTPINASLLDGVGKNSLTSCNKTLNTPDMELHNGEKPLAKPSNQPSDPSLHSLDCWAKQDKDFSSSPLYRRESVISLPLDEDQKSEQTRKESLCNTEIPVSMPAQSFSTPPSRRPLPVTSTASFSNMHSVFSEDVPLSRNNELKTESGFLGPVCLSYNTSSTLSYSTASTQTPPELSLPQDDLQMESAYLSESDLSATSQIYSPGQSSVSQSSLIHHYPRSTVRGGYEVHRVNVRAPGGCFINQAHHESGSVYSSQENGYQLKRKPSGGTVRRNGSIAGWSDSSQVSSPDREATYLVDSAHGDSLPLSAAGIPVTGPPPHTLMPVYSHMRVAFSAARATNLAPGTLDQPIAFDLLHSNLGGAFDVTSGHFICPAAGTYVFFFHILKLAISVPLYINLMRNDEVMASAYANDGAPDHETASNHALLPLRLSDHVWLRLHRGAIYGSSWKYSTFSGFLLYQD